MFKNIFKHKHSLIFALMKIQAFINICKEMYRTRNIHRSFFSPVNTLHGFINYVTFAWDFRSGEPISAFGGKPI